MRNDLEEIRQALVELAEAEATKLYRLAWRMQAHGCSKESIRRCREEASALHMTGYPENLIRYESHDFWKYAFKF